MPKMLWNFQWNFMKYWAKFHKTSTKICNRNSGFLREFADKFPMPGGNLKIRGNLKISRGRSPREIFKFTRVFPNSRRQREYMSIFTRKTRISYIFFSSFPVLCNTKHFLLTMPRGNIPIARNIIDNLIKPNTAKPMKTLQLDANFWLPQKKVIS